MKFLLMSLLPFFLLGCVTEVISDDPGIPTISTCGCEDGDDEVCDCSHDGKAECKCPM
ncbi:hypothetical protein P3T73_05535 [Kiritimatiellota bacterium B12222]|nr:hypothetical protein P3T73_05535 [Kiritimatiellota bacterium B12222]